MIKIAPSMLSCDFSSFGAQTARMGREGADLIHMDVMDGHFVPNITFGAPVMKTVKKMTDVPFDVHLMISEPLRYIEDFAKAGADIITFHIESDSPAEKCIELIKKCGVKAGISVKPKTDIEEVFPYLQSIDMVLVMTVEPGFGGQSFMEDMMPKVRKVKNKIIEKGLSVDVEVDGGISLSTIGTAAKNGANVFVAGSSVFSAENSQKMISDLRAAASDAYDF